MKLHIFMEETYQIQKDLLTILLEKRNQASSVHHASYIPSATSPVNMM